MTGWIKIHRQMEKWEWYRDIPTKCLFIHILLSANHEPGRFMGHEIPIGSFPTGLHSLSENSGLTISQVRTALEKLENTQEIAIKKNNKFSIISVTKWSIYQEGSQTDRTTIANGSQTDRNNIRMKEDKNVRKEYTKPEDVSEIVWNDFLSHRKAKKSKVTETALNGIRREADKAGWTMEAALQEICQRGWQGFKAEWVTTKGNGNENSRRTLTKSERLKRAGDAAIAELFPDDETGHLAIEGPNRAEF